MSASSDEEDYHSAEEREGETAGERDSADTGDLSRSLQESDKDVERGEESVESVSESKETEKAPESLTEEEIAV